MTCTREEEDRITYRHVPQDCLWMESSPHRLRPCDPVQPGGPVPFAVTLSRKRNPEQYPYTLNGHQLKHVDVAKYLGVQISHDLHWDKYIEYITSKANSTLGFLSSFATTSTSIIHKSKNIVIKHLCDKSSNTANLSGTHIRLVQLKRSSQSSEEQHIIQSTDTVEHLVSDLCYLS